MALSIGGIISAAVKGVHNTTKRNDLLAKEDERAALEERRVGALEKSTTSTIAARDVQTDLNKQIQDMQIQLEEMKVIAAQQNIKANQPRVDMATDPDVIAAQKKGIVAGGKKAELGVEAAQISNYVAALRASGEPERIKIADSIEADRARLVKSQANVAGIKEGFVLEESHARFGILTNQLKLSGVAADDKTLETQAKLASGKATEQEAKAEIAKLQQKMVEQYQKEKAEGTPIENFANNDVVITAITSIAVPPVDKENKPLTDIIIKSINNIKSGKGERADVRVVFNRLVDVNTKGMKLGRWNSSRARYDKNKDIVAGAAQALGQALGYSEDSVTKILGGVIAKKTGTAVAKEALRGAVDNTTTIIPVEGFGGSK